MASLSFLLEVLSAMAATKLADPASNKPIKKINGVTSVKGILEIAHPYQLGTQAKEDAKNPERISEAARQITSHLFLKKPGGGLPRFSTLPLADRLRYRNELCCQFPWLERFEDKWAADTILTVSINNKIANGQRKQPATTVVQLELVSEAYK